MGNDFYDESQAVKVNYQVRCENRAISNLGLG